MRRTHLNVTGGADKFRRLLSTRALLAITAASISLVEILPAGDLLENSIFSISGVGGCLLAIWLCVSVAQDHRRGSFLRTSWILFSGDAFMQFFRYAIDSPVGQSLMAIAARNHYRNWVVIIGLVFLLAGMTVMGLGLKGMGLGLRLMARDRVVIYILGFVAFAVAAAEIYRIGWTLRTPILALMFGGVMIGVMIFRFARQIAEGQIYVVIQMLLIYLGSRCLQNFFIASGLSEEIVISRLVLALQTALPFILCIGAAARLKVTLAAAHKIENIRRPELNAALP